MAKPKTKKRTPVKTTGPLALLPAKERKRYLELVEPMFDRQLQEQFNRFLKGDVRIKGKPKKKETPVIDIKQKSRVGNPNFSVVQDTYGAYNPESIPVETFDLMKKDPQISAGLAFIKLPIIALPWRIECEDEAIGRFVEQQLKKIWRPLIRSTLTAVDYGFASHEKVFNVEKVKVTKKTAAGKKKTFYNGRALTYKKIKPHHPSTIKINIDEYDDVVSVSQFGVGSDKEIKLEKNKMFLFTHDEEFGNPFGRSRLVAAYKYWYWKELLYQFMLMYFERRGSPPVIATAPLGRSTDKAGNRRENLDVALDVAASLLSNSVAALPYQTNKNTNENMWGLNYLLDDKRGEMFIEAINHLDVAILKALWIPETTVTEGSGYSQSSVHADLFMMAEKGLVTDIEQAVNENIIPILVQANFKRSQWTECYIEMESLDFNRKITLKELFLELMRNMDNMVQIGMRPKVFPDIEKMCKILQIPVSTLEEEVDISNVQDPNAQDPNKPQKAGTAKVIPIDRGKTKAVPRRPTRTSSTGSREVDRKKITPGGKRADQMRGAGALTEYNFKRLEVRLEDEPGTGQDFIESVYQPQPDETGEIPVSENVRLELLKMSVTTEGLKEIKKGLTRIRIWSRGDLINDFELMDHMHMVRAINALQDFNVEILWEAMSAKLSED